MSGELKLIIVTTIFVLEWIYVCLFRGANIGNKIYDEQLEELKKNEESIHHTDEQEDK